MDNKQMVTAPCLLQGRKQIAATFRVMPDTVREWNREGAPFFMVGKMWQVDYRDLVEWLKKNRPANNAMESENA